MSQNVFEISDLSCSYNRKIEDRVIYIEHLAIPKGELVFLLGASGSGKSTLLEAIGLMNNTIAGGKLEFYQDDKTEPIDLQKLWEGENALAAAEIRKQSFSFIFQNTNLMENFTAYENICMSKMIQEDISQEKVMVNARELMESVGLPETAVNINTLSVNLSGGQKQRIAFVRSLCTEFQVLFGDEPTGNLDERNANELMSLIRANLGDKSTAVIVSHDINLALNHASRIICISRSDHNYGEIKAENVFLRKDWENLDHEGRLQFRNKILSFYLSNVDERLHKKIPAVSGPPAKLNNTFWSLFFRKESLALAGAGMRNLFILIALLLCTFLAIGFANGSISYLEEKIKDPFVNWLTITIPASKSHEADRMKEELNDASKKSQYLIKSVNSYTEEPLRFYSRSDSAFLTIRGRSIDVDDNNRPDPIIYDITRPENLLRGTAGGFSGKKDLSVIVCKRLLDDLGYDLDTKFINMEVTVYDSSKKTTDTVPMAIRAIVKDMPGKFQVVYTKYFYFSYMQNEESTFDKRTKRTILFYCLGQKRASEFQNAVDAFFKRETSYDSLHPMSNINKNNDTYEADAKQIEITFSPKPSYSLYSKITTDLLSSAELKPFSDVRLFYDRTFTPHFENQSEADALSVNFERLDKVRPFANYIIKQYNDAHENRMGGGGVMEVDLAKVKEKENFNYLVNITQLISIIVILFGAISVCLFIYNLLKTHLLKVKMNIGTFKAFGLSNTKAQNIYFLIVSVFLLLSVFTALILAGAIGFLVDVGLHHKIVAVDNGMSFFKLIDWNTLYALIVILLMSTFWSRRTISNILSKSPGDLIYNR